MDVYSYDMNKRIELAAPSPEHQKLVGALAKALREQRGLQLRGVAHDDYEDKPYEIGGFVPDVIAYDEAKELLVIGEAETCDHIDTEHTRDQIKAWTNRVMSEGKSKGVSVPVHVIVPSNCKNDLETFLVNLSVRDRVTVWSL